jgi:hypothetical protein
MLHDIEVNMLQAELTGLRQRQLEIGREVGDSSRFRRSFAIEIAVVGKEAELADLLGDHDTARRWRDVLAEYLRDPMQ